jgi:uncharacterized protein (TIGR04255 family)
LEEYPKLTKAPIKEALIDLRVKLPSDFDVKRVDSVYEKVNEKYPERQEQRHSQLHFALKPGSELVQSVPSRITGYRYISKNKNEIFQARLDGFTYNRLPPYLSWEEFRNEANRLWLLFKETVLPEAITRVALRYINNLNIPMPIIDFADYLTAPPVLPEGLPQGLNSFLIRLNVHVPELEANAIITQALEPMPVEMAKLPVILDIEVIKERTAGIEEREAWNLLEKMRNFKNEIFFRFITEKLKEIYI